MAKPTTLPVWDTTAVNVTTPVMEQSVGWGTDQAPSAQVFNWLHYWTYRWAEYINSALGMAADAWAWTGRHTFNRPHATESAVEISNSGGGQALVVTGPSTTGSLDSTSIDADSVATRSLSSISVSGTAATITNSDPLSTAATLIVTHSGGLQRALQVTGDTMCFGYVVSDRGISCSSSAGTAISGESTLTDGIGMSGTAGPGSFGVGVKGINSGLGGYGVHGVYTGTDSMGRGVYGQGGVGIGGLFSSASNVGLMVVGNTIRAPLNLVPLAGTNVPAVATAQKGDLYFDDDDLKLKVFNGTAWTNCN